jgi:Flp pilus assembly protein TadG
MLLRGNLFAHVPTRPRRAAAVVEFAVVAPLLFALVLGIIEFGRAMMVLELLNNAARAGCRAGVLSGSSNTDVNSAITTALTGSGVNSPSTTIDVNGSQADVSTAQTGDTISVTVSVGADAVTWLPVPQFLGGKTLTGIVAMRRE